MPAEAAKLKLARYDVILARLAERPARDQD